MLHKSYLYTVLAHIHRFRASYHLRHKFRDMSSCEEVTREPVAIELIRCTDDC